MLYSNFELISIVVSVAIVALIAIDGKCHWLEGAQLLAVYAIIALAFFFIVKDRPRPGAEEKPASAASSPVPASASGTNAEALK